MLFWRELVGWVWRVSPGRRAMSAELFERGDDGRVPATLPPAQQVIHVPKSGTKITC